MPEFFQRMTGREKTTVLVGAVVVGTILVYGFLFAPAVEKKDRWLARASDKKRELVQFKEFGIRYRELEGMLSALEKRLETEKGGVSLLTQMESVARDLGIQDRITSMKPLRTSLESAGLEESSVEIKLEKMDLRKLVEFLKRVEGSDGLVRANRLRIKTRFDDPKLLDITLLISTLEAM